MRASDAISNDLTSYLFNVVLTALLLQWYWVYLVIKNPDSTTRSESKLNKKLLVPMFVIYTLLIAADITIHCLLDPESNDKFNN